MADDSAKIQQYVLLAKGARGRAVIDLINKATSEPGLYAFGELLSCASVVEVQNGEHAPHYQLLKLFAYGTCEDYKASQASLPPLNDHQKLKLKQLTVVSLGMQIKVIPYQTLQQQLEIATVRELEDFIITECFYSGIIQGKLDQKERCLQVHDVIGRDVRPEQLEQLEQALQQWLGSSHSIMSAIEERVSYAVASAEADKKHREEVEAKQEETKKNLKAEIEIRGTDMMLDAMDYGDMMDEDRMDRFVDMGAGSGRAERADRTGRPKRRLR